jgi:hypothetical protein
MSFEMFLCSSFYFLSMDFIFHLELHQLSQELHKLRQDLLQIHNKKGRGDLMNEEVKVSKIIDIGLKQSILKLFIIAKSKSVKD